LNSSNIDDLDALTISMFLSEQYTYLELCHLGSNLFEDEGLINILSGLQWHTSLQELYLGKKFFFSKVSFFFEKIFHSSRKRIFKKNFLFRIF